MKTSISYLPEEKRDDLKRIVRCLLKVLPACEMRINEYEARRRK